MDGGKNEVARKENKNRVDEARLSLSLGKSGGGVETDLSPRAMAPSCFDIFVAKDPCLETCDTATRRDVCFHRRVDGNENANVQLMTSGDKT